ncbi:hypothetical protein EHJ07_18830 [Cronobacter muytjensii]|nr:hypothetical protein [Cronobacter muytjensii]
MKYLLIIVAWVVTLFIFIKSFYAFIPAETQYAFAEFMGCYGDENVMDFILYVFTCTGGVASTLLLYFFLQLIKCK